MTRRSRQLLAARRARRARRASSPAWANQAAHSRLPCSASTRDTAFVEYLDKDGRRCCVFVQDSGFGPGFGSAPNCVDICTVRESCQICRRAGCSVHMHWLACGTVKGGDSEEADSSDDDEEDDEEGGDGPASAADGQEGDKSKALPCMRRSAFALLQAKKKRNRKKGKSAKQVAKNQENRAKLGYTKVPLHPLLLPVTWARCCRDPLPQRSTS